MKPYFVFKDWVWMGALFVFATISWLRLKKARPVFIVPFAASWSVPRNPNSWHRVSAFAFGVSIVLLIFAAARPQKITQQPEYGIAPSDIIIALDVSRSMLAEDYEIDGRQVGRLELLKPILEKFITRRAADRIGIVVFSGRAYTMVPPTLNHARLVWLLRGLDIENLSSGSALGDGLVLALERLRELPPSETLVARKPFVILVSDGSANGGVYSRDDALEVAKGRHIPVYTVAVGTGGYADIPYIDESGQKKYSVDLTETDEGFLWLIAQQSGGAFFRGANLVSSQESFDTIGERQTARFVRGKHNSAQELYPWFAVPGLILLLLSYALSFQSIPRAFNRCGKRVWRTIDGSFPNFPRVGGLVPR